MYFTLDNWQGLQGQLPREVKGIAGIPLRPKTEPAENT